jgi:hypothetical protein
MVNYIQQTDQVGLLGNKSLELNTVTVMTAVKEKIEKGHSGDMRFLWLLAATQFFFSTDPRDRLFALYGLFDLNLAGIQVGYSISCEELYRKWAVHRIIDEEDLSCL